MSLLIGVPKEVFPGEKRVATVPEVVQKLIKQGFRVAVEAGAGDAAQINDDAYRAAGAEIVADRATLWAMSDIVFKVRGPNRDEVGAAARRRHAGQLHLAGAEPRAAASSSPPGRPRCWRWTACRASRGRRSSTRSPRWPTSVATVPSSRRRTSSAASSPVRSRLRARCRPPRSSSSAPASRVLPPSAPRPAWAPSCAPTTRDRKSRTRSNRWAASSCPSTTRRRAAASAATPR